jgi:hypothetical protein
MSTLGSRAFGFSPTSSLAGWGVCGTCMLIAEGILARPGEDMLTQRALWWQVPLATGVIAVLFVTQLSLMIRPFSLMAYGSESERMSSGRIGQAGQLSCSARSGII